MKKLLVVFLVLAFVAPAMAAEWNLYGSARMNVGIYDRDENWTKTSNAGGTFDSSDGINDDTDTLWTLQGNSRVGAKVKTSDVIGGRFEYGVKDGLAQVRLLYGTWNFGSGTLTVGQDYTPCNTLLSNQVGAVFLGDDDFLFIGAVYDGRRPQLKVDIAGLQVALIEPSTAVTDADGYAYSGYNINTTLPKIEVAYKYATDMFMVNPYFGYNSVEVEESGIANPDSRDVDSMVYGLAFTVNVGPAFIKGNIYNSTNPGNFSLFTAAPTETRNWYPTTSGEEDAEQMGGFILAGFKVNDMVTLEAGYGMISNELEVEGVKIETEMSTYYINCQFTVAPGFTITPEYGFVDLGDEDVSYAGYSASGPLGEASYFAAKLQIDF